jgi:sugar lactone lactonase YvrE
MAELELVLDARAELGEGPIWDGQRQLLYWVDILGKSIHVYEPVGRISREIKVGQMVGAVAPRASGGLVAALQGGFALVDDQSITALPGPDIGFPANRFNDGKCDPQGRFWAGTMSLAGPRQPTGALYVLGADYSIQKKLDQILCSNGTTWSRDGRTMYYIDTGLKRVDAFDFDPRTAGIANRRTIAIVPEEMGHPDGMTIDEQGKLWVALWGGYAVSRWDPASGKLLDLIKLPVAKVTSCMFGGPDLADLYVTSARSGFDEAALAGQPLAGGLFRIRTGFRGWPAQPFAG